MNKVTKYLWSLIEKIVECCLKVTFGALHRELKQETIDALMQFIKFGLVGLSNTVISYVIYVVSLKLLQVVEIFPQIDYLVAQIIAFVLSVAWSFYWNNKYVFTTADGESRSIWRALLKTYVSYSFTGLFLNSILLILWVQVIGISELVAPIINLMVSVPLNFVINKFWAFKSK